MQSAKGLQYLEELADKLGIDVVYEKFTEEEFFVRGGLCKVDGSYKIFIDQSESMDGQIAIVARALAAFDTEEIYVVPFVREVLAKARRSLAPEAK
jgi:hypothetical protein